MSMLPYSQNLLSQIRKIFVTLGHTILRFLSLEVFFWKQILLKVDVTYNDNNKMAIFNV